MKPIRLLLCALGLLAVAGRADAQVLYGATASGTPGQLFILNRSTGAAIQTIGPTNDVLGTNFPITGLAFHPVTGMLYGSTGNNPTATAARLVTINPATGLTTVIGSYNAGPVSGGGVPATMTDLAFDPAGNLFGLGSIGGPQLYSINIATGQATVIGNSGLPATTGTSGGGLEVTPAGTMFATPTSSRFGTYNPTTGVYTNIAAPGAFPAGGGAYAALAADAAGVLFGLNSGSTVGGITPTHLVTFNPATGAVTDVGPSVNFLDAIAFQPAVIPEPGSMLLVLGPAAVGLFKAARRRK